ncbi:MAG: LPXTG cell wall anchor domain-containing protein, partial [Candidatus Methylomirabilales bacterium]
GRLYVATAESIIRLPGDIPAPETPTTPMPTRAMPVSPSGDTSPLPWIIGVGGVALLGLAAVLIRRRRASG